MKQLLFTAFVVLAAATLSAQQVDFSTLQTGAIGSDGRPWQATGGKAVIEFFAISQMASSRVDTTDPMFLNKMNLVMQDSERKKSVFQRTYAFPFAGGKVVGLDTVTLDARPGKYQVNCSFDRKKLVSTPGAYFPRILEGWVRVTYLNDPASPAEKKEQKPKRFRVD